ncbi:hypothetical protein [Arthrobacter sp. UYCu723]
MEVIAKINCSGKNCPTIYRKDEDTIIVQGYVAEDLFGEPLPEGEQAVAIPVSLLVGLKL